MAEEQTPEEQERSRQFLAALRLFAEADNADAIKKAIKSFVKALLGLDDQTLERDYGISQEDLIEEYGPRENWPTRDWTPDEVAGFQPGNTDGPLGTGTPIPPAPQDVEQRTTRAALEGLSRDLTAATPGDRAAELARRFVGQHETGHNAGAIVDLVRVNRGDPWCGGFTHHILSQTMPGVYDQDSFRSALSYRAVGERYHAFHRPGTDYAPKPGDVIVFERDGPNSGKGHVGVVTGYDPVTHRLTYVSGNDGNAVREREIDMSHPPRRMLGITDSTAVAQARGIHIEAPAATQHAAVPTSSAAHPAATVAQPHQAAAAAHGAVLASAGTRTTGDHHGAEAHFNLASVRERAHDIAQNIAQRAASLFHT